MYYMAHGNDRYTLVNDRITDQHIEICKLELEITRLKARFDCLLFALEKQTDIDISALLNMEV